MAFDYEFGQMAIPVVMRTGSEAWAQLLDHSFQQEWRRLYDECPWATPFQSSAFVNIWYDNYRNSFSPIIISQYGKNQRLCGLLTLAISEEQKSLVVAGAHHAEYQAWLAAADDHGDFIIQATTVLYEAFPGYYLVFKYLPAGIPIQTLMDSRRVAKRIELKIHRRPLMQINEKDLEASFHKKSNKSRFNRLKRLGKLEFERVTDWESLASIFDEIISCYDIRQGAINNSFPFLQDKQKKFFHLNLMKQHPDLLHVTITTLNGRLIAAHIGIAGKNQIHLAILANSPFYASYSPGKLHLMFLSKLFAHEGIKFLDLTPGNDPWKERFANCHDEVYELFFYKSANIRTLCFFWTKTKDLIKAMAKWIGVTPDKASHFLNRLKHIHISNIVYRLCCAIWKKAEFRVYRHTIESLKYVASGGQMRKDYLPDLLKFEPIESWQTKQRFMANALQRLELGEHVYTYASEERLLHVGWLIEEQHESFFPEVQQRFKYPEKSAVLYDSFTRPEVRGGGLYHKSLRQMLADIKKLKDVKYVYISVLADNGPSRHVIEKLGFEYQCSLFHLRILGFSWKRICYNTT